MMLMQHDVDLQPLCTLATPAKAAHYCYATTLIEVQEALACARMRGWPLMILGGGSNIVWRADFEGLVLHMGIRGISARAADQGYVLVQASAGESWQQVVDFTLAQGLWGLENLTLIPGTVGAAPIQNIGAYGVEFEQNFVELSALRVEDGALCRFDHAACHFTYRDSLFKKDGHAYVIIDVTLKLSQKAKPVLSYAGLADFFKDTPIEALTPQHLADAVAQMRRAKLPDPKDIPNTGSFFHNPIVSGEQERELRSRYPDLVSYALPSGQFKLAAAWLIDKAGLKGYSDKGVGVHAHQALVIVNPGKKPGREVLAFAQFTAQKIEREFGVRLAIEPQIYP